MHIGFMDKQFYGKISKEKKVKKRVHGIVFPDTVVTPSKKKSIIEAPPSELIAAIEKELQNDHPRDDVLISLMNSFFRTRKTMIDAKQSLLDILKVYAALKRPSIVSKSKYLLFVLA